ncbi:MAG TPA: hypothetical protein VFM88_19850 [Vicinamibacteria bacterium]|nr:hypothetical protein [Vicinamibacteria bacterium]
MAALALLLVAASAPVSVTATAGKSEVSVGERFAVELHATGPEGTAFSFPGALEADAFELRPAPAGTAPEQPGARRYEATVFALGEARLPPIPVRYRLPDGTEGEAASEPIVVKVASLLPKDPQQQKLADIRGPLPVAIGRAFWIALATAALLAAAIALWLVGRLRRRGAPPAVPVPEVPPDAEALRALDALAARGLLARGEYRAFYIQLAAVAKRYLERRLGAPVLEMTTSETLAFLRGHPHGGDLVAPLKELTGAADRVKFANGCALAPEAERDLAAVRALVPALEARLAPRPQADGKAA